MQKNKTLLNGFFAAALFFIWKMFVLFIGKQHDWLASFPGGPLLLLTGIFIFLSIVRSSTPDASFTDDFKSGARTALSAAILAGLFVYVYYAFFDPEFMPIRIQQNIENARNSGVSEDDLLKAEEDMQKFFAPFTYSTLTVSATAFFGMAFSLIVSGLKRAFKVL